MLKKSVLFALVLGTAITATPTVAKQTEPLSAETIRLLDLLADVRAKIHSSYVEDSTDTDLMQGAIQGMLQQLDPHSAYISKADLEQFKSETSGQFGGIGIEIEPLKTGNIVIVSPIDDTPGQRAGLQAGDIITHIDGIALRTLSFNKSVAKMRGKVGTKLTITITRTGKPPFDVEITRDTITVKSVRHRVEKNMGYVRISKFQNKTGQDLKTAIAKIQTELGDDFAGLVLDLRNNPGGLLTQAIAVSDAFLQQGEIVSTRGRTQSQQTRTFAKLGDILGGKPIVVLINGGSASASEIVAGALQDHRRAVILGTKSFGKGSVQTLMDLGDNRGMIKLTTARYYTPSGKSIQGQGITPDVVVVPSKIEPLTAHKSISESQLQGSLKTESTGTTDAEKAKKKKEYTDKVKDDYQLQRALDLLTAIAIQNQQAPLTQTTDMLNENKKAQN